MSRIAFEMDLPSDLAHFRLPEGVQARLQTLLDRQDAGQALSMAERQEAEGLLNLAEFLTILRQRTERPGNELGCAIRGHDSTRSGTEDGKRFKTEHSTYWYKNLTHREVDGVRVPGIYFPAFIHNFDYHLTEIIAYRDNMVFCWGLVTFEEFRKKVESGWVVTSLPDGAQVTVFHVARFKASDVIVEGSELEFIKDVANAIEELNGRPTAQSRLHWAMRGLKAQDTPELRRQLRQAYEDLPAYRRRYVFGSRMEKHKDIQRMLDEAERYDSREEPSEPT